MTKKKTTTTKAKTKSIWETLSVINCNEHIEQKGSGKFTAKYLSWTWAWGILMQHYPNATFDNHLNSDGYPCFFDVNGNAMVRVTLHIGEQSHTEDYMVTDNKNQSIKNPNSYDVNTALKRCLVKCMAYFGLGHYIYAGEDLPQMTRESMMTIVDGFLEFDGDEGASRIQKAVEHYGKNSIEELSDSELERIVNKIADIQKKGN